MRIDAQLKRAFSYFGFSVLMLFIACHEQYLDSEEGVLDVIVTNAYINQPCSDSLEYIGLPEIHLDFTFRNLITDTLYLSFADDGGVSFQNNLMVSVFSKLPCSDSTYHIEFEDRYGNSEERMVLLPSDSLSYGLVARLLTAKELDRCLNRKDSMNACKSLIYLAKYATIRYSFSKENIGRGRECKRSLGFRLGFKSDGRIDTP